MQIKMMTKVKTLIQPADIDADDDEGEDEVEGVDTND
jgi:hypothetical protein